MLRHWMLPGFFFSQIHVFIMETDSTKHRTQGPTRPAVAFSVFGFSNPVYLGKNPQKTGGHGSPPLRKNFARNKIKENRTCDFKIKNTINV